VGSINLRNSKGRDAVVNTEGVSPTLRVRWLDAKGRQAMNVRLIRSTLDRDLGALVAKAGALEKIADLLVQEDPEIDVETFGSFLQDTSRVYVDPDRQIVRKVQEFDIVRLPDGSVKERRPRQVAQANTATETPLTWTGKLLKKSEVYNKFVFSSKSQIVHVNGLTYDFLHGMAKELEEKESLMLLGAGPKGAQPLVFVRGGNSYRGFLEGRTQGDAYCLLLHLSNLEFKVPEATTTA
jgi:hypothetical protein